MFDTKNDSDTAPHVIEREKGGLFKKGHCPNPRGNNPGITTRKLREAIMEGIPEVLDKLREQALAGDTSASKILVDRVCAPLKASSAGVQLGSFTPDAVAQLFSEGEIDTDVAHQLLGTMLQYQQFQQNLDLEKRLASIEQKLISNAS